MDALKNFQPGAPLPRVGTVGRRHKLSDDGMSKLRFIVTERDRDQRQRNVSYGAMDADVHRHEPGAYRPTQKNVSRWSWDFIDFGRVFMHF